MTDHAFTRQRKLPLVHLVGHILKIPLDRNQNGYEILSQDYFGTLGVSRSSFSEARAQLSWEAFEFLLSELQKLPELGDGRWRGLRVFAGDGTQLSLPHTPEILERFPLSTCPQNRTHYPKALALCLVNVLTGVPLTFDLQRSPGWSERDGLKRLLGKLEKHDLLLLDRGFDGLPMMRELSNRHLYFVIRQRSDPAGSGIKKELRRFLCSGRKWQRVRLKTETRSLSITLLRADEKDRDGLPILLATNLPKRLLHKRREVIELYKNRWSIETFYSRTKSMLAIERFHARTYNGVLQEIWANFFVLGLTAYLARMSAEEFGTEFAVSRPNFKAATKAVERALPKIVKMSQEGRDPQQILHLLLKQISALLVRRRPGRHFPRICKRPSSKWTPLGNKNRPRNATQKKRALAAKQQKGKRA
ncbi:MAG: IS4 family transposase [Bdellovibrionaceae bacterium]|nr:IS4 family transposase [Pseudobdellovibrionaceae bacterium]